MKAWCLFRPHKVSQCLQVTSDFRKKLFYFFYSVFCCFVYSIATTSAPTSPPKSGDLSMEIDANDDLTSLGIF